MQLLQKRFLAVAAVLAVVAVPAVTSALVINEIRVDQTGSDNDEYFELAGTPGEALGSYTYIVIGDGTGGCGVVEAVVPLTGQSIQADGYLWVGESTALLFGPPPDYVPAGTNPLNFENTDNVTHLLVSGWSGTSGQDLDTNNDGVLDLTPWTSIVDCVALTNLAAVDCTINEYTYCTPAIGPDGTFPPSHVFRCANGWLMGRFDPTVLPVLDSPGKSNATACAVVGVQPVSWSSVKGLYH